MTPLTDAALARWTAYVDSLGDEDGQYAVRVLRDSIDAELATP